MAGFRESSPVPSLAQPIAIIGMACRVPGADSLAAFWDNLRREVASIRSLSDEELLAAGVPDGLLRDPDYVKRAPVLDDIDAFDAPFFRYSAREAGLIDPQQRVFLQLCWHALEDAGYDPFRCPETIGVFAGAGGNISSYLLAECDQFRSHLGSTAGVAHLGNDKDFLATRVSYKLNLRGPAVTVQTACSTSLVAVHLARQSILLGESEMALAGGVTVRVPHVSGYLARSGDVSSPDGCCRPFDAEANGTVFGSGAGVVVLKRLDRALADGDQIYATLLGSAINNDGGEKLSYTASCVAGQVACMQQALRTAAVDPVTIDYVEAHGAATLMGDPLEIDALNRAYGPRPAGHCGVGSVKGNLGHLEAAAGIIGLIKTALALHHGVIPPSLYCTRPNPRIPLAGGPFQIVTQLLDWPSRERTRRAAVNSLGVGGTNAHVILEEAPTDASEPQGDGAGVLTLSAPNERALRVLIERYVEFLESRPFPRWLDICYTAAVGRARFSHRLAILASNACEAVARLRRFLAQSAETGVWHGVADEGRSSEISHCAESEADWQHAARQFVAGADFNWEQLDPSAAARRRVSLPGYPFAKQRCWIDEPTATEKRGALQMLLGPRRVSARSHEVSYESSFTIDAFPALLDHCVYDQLVVPGAAYLSMLLSACDDRSRMARQIEFVRPWIANRRAPYNLQLLRTPGPTEETVEVYTCSAGASEDHSWQLRMRGQLVDVPTPDINTSLPLQPNRAADGEAAGLYAQFRDLGLALGPAFQTVHRFWREGNQLWADLVAPAKIVAELDQFWIHPAILDGCFQLLVGRAALFDGDSQSLYLPLSLERVVPIRRPKEGFRCHVCLRDGECRDREILQADLTLFDANGVLAQILGFAVKRADRAAFLRSALGSDSQQADPSTREQRLAIGRRGNLDELRLEPMPPRALAEGEVRLDVQSAGLNFRDILNALGRYPGEPGELGMECAGRVREVGPGVSHIAMGDEVLALAQGSLATSVVARADQVCRRPRNLTIAQASAVPVVFATASLALHHRARLQAGQRVLVHAAAGGVGWAVIQLARRIGAEIFATASRTKWPSLEALGIKNIYDSRSLKFAEQILADTSGLGVHIVVNSLANEFIPASLSTLAPAGHFIELGKLGIWSEEQIRQRRPDVAYHVLALDQLMQASSPEVGVVLRELCRSFEEGEVEPPPLTSFPLASATAAFRRIQQGKHVGKLVLEILPRTELTSETNRLTQPPTAGLETSRQIDPVRILHGGSPEQRRKWLQHFVHQQARMVLGTPDDRPLDEQIDLPDQGLDSLLAVELLHRLRTALSPPLQLPSTLLFEYPTLAELTDYLAAECR